MATPIGHLQDQGLAQARTSGSERPTKHAHGQFALPPELDGSIGTATCVLYPLQQVPTA